MHFAKGYSMKRDSNNKDRQEQEDLPGYPHYPSNEDITAGDNNNGKVRFDEENISLPDVSDIPGQENINPAPLGIIADTTISSDDEEGTLNNPGLDDDEDDELKIVMGTEADVTEEDLLILGEKDQDMDMGEDEAPGMQGLDDTDDDGELLNEGAHSLSPTGDDLDIPGRENRDLNEPANQDEENDYYSLGSDDNDETTEGTP
jgi:hypothetical protein